MSIPADQHPGAHGPVPGNGNGNGNANGVGNGVQGVIHDIGYRHYDGHRLGIRQIRTALFLDTLRGCYGLGRTWRSKIMPAALLAMTCLPALIVVVITNVTGEDELPIPYSGYAFALQLLLAIYVAGQAPQAVSRDLRYGVVPLYFSRPLRRDDYVLAKFTAMTTAVLTFLVIPLTILYIGALLAKLPWWEQTKGMAVGLVGALLLALLLAGIGLVVAAAAPRRGLGIAAIITVLVVANTVSGVVQGIALAEGQTTVARYAPMLSPAGLVDGVLVRFLNAESSAGQGPPGTLGGLVFLTALVLLVATCYGLLLARYRKVSVS